MAKAAMDQFERKNKLAGRMHHLKGTRTAPGVLASKIRLRDASGHAVWIASPRSKRHRTSGLAMNPSDEMSERDLTSNHDYKTWLKTNVGRNARKLSIAVEQRQGAPGGKPVNGPFLPRNWLKERIEAKTNQTLRVSTDFYDTGNFRRMERSKERDARVSSMPMSIPRVIQFEKTPTSIQNGQIYKLAGHVSFRRLDQAENERKSFRHVLPPISHRD
jgi:hypothetical protein